MLSGLLVRVLLAVFMSMAAIATDAQYSILNLQHDTDVDIAKSAITSAHPLRRLRRGTTSNRDRLWPYAIIPYEIDLNFTSDQKALFKRAMQHWELYSCLQFIERDLANGFNEEPYPYILFTVLSCGCCTMMIGRPAEGPLNISINQGCDSFGIVVHELGHAIGFYHEQARPDRDKYVRVLMDNVIPSMRFNFEIAPEIDSLGLPYDFGSIMHYRLNQFSREPNLPTIVVLDVAAAKLYGGVIGQQEALSIGDIMQANLLYQCPFCGQTLLESSGVLMVPNAAVDKPLECDWRISTMRRGRIVLLLNELSIGSDCRLNYVEVRDGFWIGSPVIAVLCGSSKKTVELQTNGNRMLITLRTQAVAAATNRPVFAASYRTIWH